MDVDFVGEIDSRSTICVHFRYYYNQLDFLVVEDCYFC